LRPSWRSTSALYAPPTYRSLFATASIDDTSRYLHASAKGPFSRGKCALLKDVRVRPVPYHGGGFAGRGCHRNAVRGSIFCDALEGLIPAPQLAALRTAWAARAGVARTLNRAEEIPAGEVSDFCSALERLVPDFQVIFPWLSVSPKLHALTHHAPTFLRRFGSLGSYAEQALEAWHAFFNRAQAQCTADSFLGSCA